MGVPARSLGGMLVTVIRAASVGNNARRKAARVSSVKAAESCCRQDRHQDDRGPIVRGMQLTLDKDRAPSIAPFSA